MKPSKLNPEDLVTTQNILERGAATDLSHLKRVILEVHNYCNRSCSFCPNSMIDRRSSLTPMADKVFFEILDSLKQGGFKGTLMFGRYHEPLADKIILTRIREALDYLPDIRISLNSNGDYFSQELCVSLKQSGLSDMKIMIYLPNRQKYSDNAAISGIYRFANRHHLKIENAQSIEGNKHIYNVVEPQGFSKYLSLHCENYRIDGYGCDRGASITFKESSQRNVPCYAPFFELNVDYNGSILPCCNLLSDVASHKDYVLGNAGVEGLLKSYNSTSAIKFRNNVVDTGKLPSVCMTCQYYWPNRTE